MKTRFYIILILMFLFCTSCRMIRHEAERSINKDITEYMDDNFNTYAEKHYQEKLDVYKNRFGYVIGSISTVIALLGGSGGLLILKRKLKNKENETL